MKFLFILAVSFSLTSCFWEDDSSSSSDLTPQVNQNTADIDSLEVRMTDAENVNVSQSASIVNIENEFVILSNQVNEMPDLGDVDALENKIIALQDSDASQNISIDTLNGAVANLVNDVATLETTTQQQGGAITTLQTNLSSIFDRMGVVEGRVSVVENNISSINAKDAQQDALLANTYSKDQIYDKSEVDAKLEALPLGMIPKDSVATYADLATYYPNPELNWAVQVQDENKIYVYSTDGTPRWVDFYVNVTPLASETANGLFSSTNYVDLYDAIDMNTSQNSTLASQAATITNLVSLTSQQGSDISSLQASDAQNTAAIASLVVNDAAQTTGINGIRMDTDRNTSDIAVLDGKIADTYSRSYIDTNFYTQSQIQDTYYTKTQVDTNLSTNFYDKPYIDANFYGKSYIDGAFYSKADIDGNYYNKAESYNKGEVDSIINGLPVGMIPKTGVNTIDELIITYPDPVKNWAVEVKDENTIYVYSTDGTPMWVPFYTSSIPLASDTQNGLLSSVDFLNIQSLLSQGASQTQDILLLEARVDSVENLVQAQDGTISTLQTSVAGNTNAISTINGQLGNFYSKSYIDSNFYDKPYIDANFYNKTYVNNNYYTKAQIDARQYIDMSYLTSNYSTTAQMNSAIDSKLNSVLSQAAQDFLQSKTTGTTFTAVNNSTSVEYSSGVMNPLIFTSITNSAYISESTSQTSGSVFKVLKSGKYSGELNLNFSGTSNDLSKAIYIFVEFSADGVSWTSRSSARTILIGVDGSMGFNFGFSTTMLNAGTYFRFVLYKESGGAPAYSLATTSEVLPISGSPTVTANAMELKIMP